MFNGILQRFAEKSPVTVMVRGMLEHLLNQSEIDAWFNSVRHTQYTKDILFSSIVSLMLNVVCKFKPSVHAAFRYSNIEASVVALYGKLQNIEPTTSQELVRKIAVKSESIIREMKGSRKPLLPGYKFRFLDGNCIESTEHRLKVLRGTRAGALPGKSLVVYDAELDLVVDVFPCEDGHAQERSLLGLVLSSINESAIWVADRNFCVLSFLFGIHQKSALFVIRQHQGTPYTPLTELKYVGPSEMGAVFEQRVLLSLPTGEVMTARRIVVDLETPTRNGDKILSIFTNIPENVAGALTISEIYRNRWKIETAFQKLEKYLNSEINTLGYPKAALFGFCIALVAYNIYAVIMAALRSHHNDEDIDDKVSGYYIAEEISETYAGMLIAVPEEDWMSFDKLNVSKMSSVLLYLASMIDFSKFKKSKRGPKKATPPKDKFLGKPHVSTAKLLAGAATG